MKLTDAPFFNSPGLFADAITRHKPVELIPNTEAKRAELLELGADVRAVSEGFIAIKAAAPVAPTKPKPAPAADLET